VSGRLPSKLATKVTSCTLLADILYQLSAVPGEQNNWSSEF